MRYIIVYKLKNNNNYLTHCENTKIELRTMLKQLLDQEVEKINIKVEKENE